MQEKYKNKIQWKCVQKLTEHTERVRHLSLNSDGNLLATSGGYD
jgi:WD40 repeat protein